MQLGNLQKVCSWSMMAMSCWPANRSVSRGALHLQVSLFLSVKWWKGSMANAVWSGSLPAW